MSHMIRRVLPVLVLVAGVTTQHAQAQGLRQLNAAPTRSTMSICGLPVEQPAAVPPTTSGPVVYKLAPCFARQGGSSRSRAELYLRDIHLRPSRPTDAVWVPYDADAERMILEDFQRLWNNNGLADLSIEVQNYVFSNGVVGKLVTYHITERR
jgi:hypothetical protein